MILALSEKLIGAPAKAGMTMFDSVENGILADVQSKTSLSR